MGFKEMQAQLESVAELALLEGEYNSAKEAFREDPSEGNKERFKEAKEAFVSARANWREQEVNAGRRTSGVTATEHQASGNDDGGNE